MTDETTPKLIVSNMEHFIVAGTDLWNLQELVHVPGAISLAGVDIHVEAQRLYFSDSKLKKLRSMNLDGSNLTEVWMTKIMQDFDFADRVGSDALFLCLGMRRGEGWGQGKKICSIITGNKLPRTK